MRVFYVFGFYGYIYLKIRNIILKVFLTFSVYILVFTGITWCLRVFDSPMFKKVQYCIIV
jgi:hypothetical protein